MSDPTTTSTTAAPQAAPAAAPRQLPVRRIAAIALIWVGALFAATSAAASYAQYMGFDRLDALPIVVGYVLYLAGWLLVPTAMAWRRAVATVIAFFSLVIYLHTFQDLFTGLDTGLGLVGGGLGDNPPIAAFFLAVSTTGVVAAWLVARNRRPIAYVALAPVFLLTLLSGYISSGSYWSAPFSGAFLRMQLPLFLSLAAGLVIGWGLFTAGGAWLAVGFEKWIKVKAPQSAESSASADAQAVAPGSTPGTNVLAILAIIFGIGGGVLGIVFGHVARAQIRRTGEQGWGLATAGLVLGYIGVSATILFFIIYVVIIGSILAI